MKEEEVEEEKLPNQEEVESQNIDKTNRFEIGQIFKNDFTDVRFNYHSNKRLFTIKKYINNDSYQEFKKEIEILSNIGENNITLSLLNHGEENGKFYFEQQAGQKDLQMVKDAYVLSNNNLESIADFLSVHFLQLFFKLEKLHSLGFAHSDIKPQNIIFGYDQEVYFIDFGGAVKLENPEQYLNQFTPSFNLQKYYKSFYENGKIKFQSNRLDNQEEITLCDFTQLALSFIWMLCLESQQILDFRQKKFNKVIQSLDLQNLYMLRLCSIILNIADSSIDVIGEQIPKEIPFIIDHESIMYLNRVIFDISYDHKKQKLEVRGINKYNIYLLDFLQSIFDNLIYDTSSIRINVEPDNQKFKEFCSNQTNINKYQQSLLKGVELDYYDTYNLCQMIKNSKDLSFKIKITDESNYFDQIVESIKFAKYKSSLTFEFIFLISYSYEIYLDQLCQFNILQLSQAPQYDYISILFNLQSEPATQLVDLYYDFDFSHTEQQQLIQKVIFNSKSQAKLVRCYKLSIFSNLKQCKQKFIEFFETLEKKEEPNEQIGNSYDLVFITSVDEDDIQNSSEQINYQSESIQEDYQDIEQNQDQISNEVFQDDNEFFSQYSQDNQFEQEDENPDFQSNTEQNHRQDESQTKLKACLFQLSEFNLFMKTVDQLIENVQNRFQLVIGLYFFKIEDKQIVKQLQKFSQKYMQLTFKVELINCEISQPVIEEINKIGKLTEKQEYDKSLKDHIMSKQSKYILKTNNQEFPLDQSNQEVHFEIYNINNEVINKEESSNKQNKNDYQELDKSGILNIFTNNKIIGIDDFKANQRKIKNNYFSFPSNYSYRNQQFKGNKLDDIYLATKQIENDTQFMQIDIIIDNIIIEYQNSSPNHIFNFQDLNIYTYQKQPKMISEHLTAFFNLYLVSQLKLDNSLIKLKYNRAAVRDNNDNCNIFSKQFKITQQKNILQLRTVYYINENDNITENIKILKELDSGQNDIQGLFIQEFQRQINNQLMISDSSIIIKDSYSSINNSQYIEILEGFLDYKVDQSLLISFPNSQLKDTILANIYQSLKKQTKFQKIQFSFKTKKFPYKYFKELFQKILSENNINQFIFEIESTGSVQTFIQKDFSQYIIKDNYLSNKTTLEDNTLNCSQYTFILELNDHIPILLK